VLFPKQEKDEEAEELRFLAMLGFKDFDDMKDALINNFDDESNTRNSREVILSTTVERIRILMNKTESSRSVIDNFVDPAFGFSTYNFAFSRPRPSKNISVSVSGKSSVMIGHASAGLDASADDRNSKVLSFLKKSGNSGHSAHLSINEDFVGTPEMEAVLHDIEEEEETKSTEGKLLVRSYDF
jgi:hypothetical protein